MRRTIALTLLTLTPVLNRRPADVPDDRGLVLIEPALAALGIARCGKVHHRHSRRSCRRRTCRRRRVRASPRRVLSARSLRYSAPIVPLKPMWSSLTEPSESVKIRTPAKRRRTLDHQADHVRDHDRPIRDRDNPVPQLRPSFPIGEARSGILLILFVKLAGSTCLRNTGSCPGVLGVFRPRLGACAAEAAVVPPWRCRPCSQGRAQAAWEVVPGSIPGLTSGSSGPSSGGVSRYPGKVGIIAPGDGKRGARVRRA